MAGIKYFSLTQVSIVMQKKLDKMTVSKSLKRLVSLGLVDRIEHQSDTRAKNVTLTDKGKEMVRTLVPIVEGVDAKFFDRVLKGDQQQLIKILSQLTQA